MTGIFLAFLLFPLLNLSQAAQGDKLRLDLLKSYDKVSRPLFNGNATVITFGMTLTHVNLDEVSSELTTHGWVQMAWEDFRLSWEPSDYYGIKSLHFSDHEIWKPDIYLCNSAQAGEIGTYGNSNLVVHHDGSILWVPPARFRSFCDVKLKSWPFDTQSCKLKFGSWSYSGSHVDLQAGAPTAELDLVTENTEWNLTSVDNVRNSQKYPCCPEPYIDITYTLNMTRRSEGYCASILLAMITVSLLSLSAFLLPTHSGVKIVVNSATLAFICFVLYAMTVKLPALTYKPPTIVLNFGCFLLLAVIAFCESVLVIKISNRRDATAAPNFLKKVFCVGVLKNDKISAFDEESLSEGDWHRVAVALDRCFFAVYAILYFYKFFAFYVMDY